MFGGGVFRLFRVLSGAVFLLCGRRLVLNLLSNSRHTLTQTARGTAPFLSEDEGGGRFFLPTFLMARTFLNGGGTMLRSIHTVRALFAATTTTLLLSAGAAYASTVTLEGSVAITETGFTGNKPSIVDVLSMSKGLPTANTEVRFFQADPAGSSGTTNHLVKGTLQAVFTFDEVNASNQIVATGSLTQNATFQANYSGTLSCSTSSSPADCIYWAGNGSTPTDDGSKYTTTGSRDNVSYIASVTDLVTMSDGDSFDVNFFDAQDWNITPDISFTNESILGPPSRQGTTPLPGALPLFAGGLGVLGLVGRRRRKKKLSRALSAR